MGIPLERNSKPGLILLGTGPAGKLDYHKRLANEDRTIGVRRFTMDV
jgi:hypothetical protein